MQINLFHIQTNNGQDYFQKINVKLNNPSNEIKINNEFFKISNIIMHRGQDINTGHYSSIICKNESEWIFVNDSIIDKKQPCIINNPYILFLEKLQPNI